MDYQEIKKKNGQRIVFCKIEELLEEEFGTIDIESKKNPSGNFICHCPFCKAEGHTKQKLYIKEDLSVGHCFVCTRAFVGINDELDISFTVPEFNFGQTASELQVVKLQDPEWTLDRYFTEFDEFSETGLKYLRGRHQYMESLYKILEFKFLDGNIVMPFKYKSEIFYYQIRFSGNSKIKYYFPPIPQGKKPPYIIERNENKKFIICEGIYDAIALLMLAPSYTPMAVLGSHITDYQLQFLREYLPEKIFVYMDETSISRNIAQKIKSVIDYCPVQVIRSEGTDPEEMLKHRIRKGLKLSYIK